MFSLRTRPANRCCNFNVYAEQDFKIIQASDCPGNTLPRNYKEHPFHVSVTEINHNAGDKTLEITCKIFRDDFEKALTQNYPVNAPKMSIDLINPSDKAAMENLVNEYIQKHLVIRADGKTIAYSGLGFEREDDAIYCYLQADNITSIKKIELTNTILYELFTDQLGIMHVTVGGNRKSSKLNYPNTQASFSF